MRINRTALPLIPILLLLALAACASKNTLGYALQQRRALDAGQLAAAPLQLRYLDKSVGDNFLCTQLTGGDAQRQLTELLLSARADQKLERQSFSPEAQSDRQLVYTLPDALQLSILYSTEQDVLCYIWAQDVQGQLRTEYSFYRPPEGFAGMLAGFMGQAALLDTERPAPFESAEELIADVDPEELALPGEDIDFDFFDGALPQYEGTSCQIYTNDELGDVPPGQLLITAYGRTRAGEQLCYSILGITANPTYTKVLLAEPDDALDSLDTQDAPQAGAVLVELAALAPEKWLVFVDEHSGDVIDVIHQGYQMQQ